MQLVTFIIQTLLLLFIQMMLCQSFISKSIHKLKYSTKKHVIQSSNDQNTILSKKLPINRSIKLVNKSKSRLINTKTFDDDKLIDIIEKKIVVKATDTNNTDINQTMKKRGLNEFYFILIDFNAFYLIFT